MEIYLDSSICLHGMHKDNFNFTYLPSLDKKVLCLSIGVVMSQETDSKTKYSRTLLRNLSRDQRIRDSLSGKTY
jgi:hypothetical protein